MFRELFVHGVDHNGSVMAVGAQFVDEGQSVDALDKREVDDKDVDVSDMFGQRESLRRCGCFQHLESLASEDAVDAFKHYGMVVDYE